MIAAVVDALRSGSRAARTGAAPVADRPGRRAHRDRDPAPASRHRLGLVRRQLRCRCSSTAPFSSAQDRSQIEMQMQVAGPAPISTSMTAIQDGSVFYMSSPLFSGVAARRRGLDEARPLGVRRRLGGDRGAERELRRAPDAREPARDRARREDGRHRSRARRSHQALHGDDRSRGSGRAAARDRRREPGRT